MLALQYPSDATPRSTDWRERTSLRIILVAMALFTWGVLVPYSLS